jgi:pimeloyl-ACP methyl ester carboxylesterase
MKSAQTFSGWRDPALGEAHEIELGPNRVRYHQTGDGPPIVFIHGFLNNANVWRKLVPHLAGTTTCITPDWPLGSHAVPVHPDADLSPPGIAELIADFAEALELNDATLLGNDSGGAYAQIVGANFTDHFSRLVLNSCETPRDTWPPKGFGHLQRGAQSELRFRLTYGPLRLARTWRSPIAYGRLASPIDERTMRSYVQPVLTDKEIRRDARKVIGSVDARYSKAAAKDLIAGRFQGPIELIWGERDNVFPLDHARAYAASLGRQLHTIPNAKTYVAEDQPESLAAKLLEVLA